MIVYEFDLDVVPGGHKGRFWLNQDDSNFTLVFRLFARKGTFTVQENTTVQVQGTKADGTTYTADATIDGNTVTVAGDADMTSAPGQGVFELVLTHSGKKLSTSNFIIHVEPAALNNT